MVNLDSPEQLEHEVVSFTPVPGYADDYPMLLAVHEALEAAKAGNFGIGAVIVDRSGVVIATGRNRVFVPSFRSDMHAEMDAVTTLESSLSPAADVSGLTLFTSLEPCPMCLARL